MRWRAKSAPLRKASWHRLRTAAGKTRRRRRRERVPPFLSFLPCFVGRLTCVRGDRRSDGIRRKEASGSLPQRTEERGSLARSGISERQKRLPRQEIRFGYLHRISSCLLTITLHDNKSPINPKYIGKTACCSSQICLLPDSRKWSAPAYRATEKNGGIFGGMQSN